MDVHKNARLTPKGREAMVQAVVDKGLSKSEAARLFQTLTTPVLTPISHAMARASMPAAARV